MKTVCMLTAIVVAGTLWSASPAWAGRSGDQVRSAVEASGYRGDDTAAILHEAERALRAGVPAGDVEIILLRSRDRGVAAATVRELINSAARAGEQGLPVRPVLDRIQQGLAKNAAPDRIAAASRLLVEKLGAARQLMDDLAQSGLSADSPQERDEAVETVARALEGSVPDGFIRDAGATAREHGRTLAQFGRAVRSFTLFVGEGMSVGTAARLVRECVEQGFAEKDHARLERTVGAILRRGGAMDDAVGAAEREIREGRDGKEPRSSGMGERGAGREPGSRGGRGR